MANTYIPALPFTYHEGEDYCTIFDADNSRVVADCSLHYSDGLKFLVKQANDNNTEWHQKARNLIRDRIRKLPV